jgi:branched-subunit amino acid transport protein
MTATMVEIGPYLALILVGFLPNEVWRVLGLVLVRGLDEDSQIVVWVRAVATAMLAAVLAQLVLSSSGALAAIPVAVRVGATGAGLLAFVVLRRSVFAGVLVGEIALIAGATLWGL